MFAPLNSYPNISFVPFVPSKLRKSLCNLNNYKLNFEDQCLKIGLCFTFKMYPAIKGQTKILEMPIVCFQKSLNPDLLQFT
jgi:hypothetical protein